MKLLNNKIDEIGMFVYSYSVWMRMNPNSNYSEWKEHFGTFDLLNTVYEIADSMSKKGKISAETKFKIIPIGNQYLKWIDENEKECNTETQKDYADHLCSPELLATEKMNYRYTFASFPIMVMQADDKESLCGKVTHFHLNQLLIDKLEYLLSQVYPNASAYVPGYVVGKDCLMYEEDRLFNMAKSFFDDHVRVRLNKLGEQHFQDKDFGYSFGYIPFVLREEITESEYSIENLKTKHDELIINWQKKNYTNIIRQVGLVKEMENIFSEQANACSFGFPIYNIDCESVEQDLIKLMESLAK